MVAWEYMRKMFAANWKANPKTLTDAKRVAAAFPQTNKIDVVVFPPALFLSSILQILIPKKITTGLQNIWRMPEGSYTGELTAGMAKNLGARFVILGHSERRQYNHETNTEVAQKISLAMQNGITPILCIGEDKQARLRGFSYACDQVLAMLRGSLKNTPKKEIVVAYEPLWAIGAKKSATREDAEEMILLIKKELRILGFRSVRVLYGGSVDEKNINMFWESPSIDGVLVGRASVTIPSVKKIMKIISS
jgi:triosephosphate isomerase